MSGGPRGTAAPLDLCAVEARLQAELQAMQVEAADCARYAAWQRSPEGQDHVAEWIGGGPENGDRDVEFYTALAQHAADCLALLAHARALRAALQPFVINVGEKDGAPAIVREKGNAWFELAHPMWDDFERAAAVLAAAQDGPA